MSAPPFRLPARIRSLSARERAMLLLCTAAVAAFLAYRLAVLPAAARYREDRSSLPALAREAARFRLASRGATRVAEASRAAERDLAALEKGLLPGKDAAAAGVVLQGLLKPWVAREDTRIVSVRPLPPVAMGEYVEVPVQVELQTTTEGLASLLARISRSPRLLRTRKLVVSASSAGVYGLPSSPRRELLVVSVVVAGVVRAAPAEGGQEPGRGGGSATPPPSARPGPTNSLRWGNR